jgi:hypothetical protein
MRIQSSSCRRLLNASVVAASILSAHGPAFLHCVARVAQSTLPIMPYPTNCHSVHRGRHDAFIRRCLRGVIGANVLDAVLTSLESSTASLETSSCPILALSQRRSALDPPPFCRRLPRAFTSLSSTPHAFQAMHPVAGAEETYEAACARHSKERLLRKAYYAPLEIPLEHGHCTSFSQDGWPCNEPCQACSCS